MDFLKAEIARKKKQLEKTNLVGGVSENLNLDLKCKLTAWKISFWLMFVLYHD